MIKIDEKEYPVYTKDSDPETKKETKILHSERNIRSSKSIK